MSTVFVTGASGVIGAHLCKWLLGSGHEVISLLHDERPVTTAKLIGVHDRITWVRGSILDATLVRRIVAEYAPGAVFHLAALPLVQIGARTTTPVIESNVLGTVNVLEAIKESWLSGRRIDLLAWSSDKAYGDAGGKPYTEDMPLNGLAIYDASKSCMDVLVRAYVKSGLIPSAVVLRPCNTLAPGDLNLGRVFPRTIIPALRGDSPVLYRTSYIREFIWIDDLIGAVQLLWKLIRSRDCGYGEAFNIGSGCQATLTECVDEVLAWFHRIEPTWVEAPALSRVEIPFQALDSSKIRDVVGWESLWDFRATVRSLVDGWHALWDKLPEHVRMYRVEGWHK